ncbi:MAG: UPF0280 family protein [Desulfarculus sp.]|nr:MAG: UPF0280 family protein [Desulfarculus sp.]
MVAFRACVKETDLWILAPGQMQDQAVDSIIRHRRGLEQYLLANPSFLHSLTPLPPDPLAPPLVKAMLAAGQTAGTGPMAAVAGAIAQAVGCDLKALAGAVVVENGGDLYLDAGWDLTVGLGAGGSPLSGRLALAIPATRMPLALATSSGTVGHSLSLGRADAATVLAQDGALADAAATALGNRVQAPADLAPALDWVSALPGVLGAVIILGRKLAAWGQVELVQTDPQTGPQGQA